MNSWTLEEAGFDPEHVEHNGNRYLCGNGYMGYRGTLEEFGKEELVACTLASLYDRRGDAWREPVNAPNALCLLASVDGVELHAKTLAPAKHRQALDFRYGIHSRQSSWKLPAGVITLETLRFASMHDVHGLFMQCELKADFHGEASIVTGIDGGVWDINGPHLQDFIASHSDSSLLLRCRTMEARVEVAVAERCDYPADTRVDTYATDQGVMRRLSWRLEPGKTFRLRKYAYVFTGNDEAEEAAQLAAVHCNEAYSTGWDKALTTQKAIWDELWSSCDVEIEGDENDQRALRYSIYHLQISAPRHAQALSIPARGLSGQTYKGAIFWDTELFMLPFFLYSDPLVARNLVLYRIKTLDGARRKAAEYGYRGAFYAWESQESGDDACSHFNVIDVFTRRPMRTYFRDRQIHISADVAWAIAEYRRVTGDEALLYEGGAEVILECARFFLSWGCYKPGEDRFEMHDVTGPDEYHERVDNDAYTNRMAYFTMETALDLVHTMNQDWFGDLLDRLEYRNDLALLERMLARLVLPRPAQNDQVIEQFDRYLKLEDCLPADLEKRLLDPREYWGGANGVASSSRVIKQADVVLMLALFPDEYSREAKRRNWEYYEPRTEHGSSLSACAYALLACNIGRPDLAYPYFCKTANADLSGESKQWAGLVYIGGTHPAASGGAWMAAILGFAGLTIGPDGLRVRPRLPDRWKRLGFFLRYRGDRYRVEVGTSGTTIRKECGKPTIEPS